ncbi:MAG TPA: hypothetical protein VJ792_01665 [Candidatus Nitrosotalea sp.]|nr:hypothetical protein [Candidatus Nitrosotalea sp.]
MARLKVSFLITIVLSVAGLVIEHSVESKVIGHLTDVSQIENTLASKASQGAGQSGFTSPKAIVYESVNMSYQDLAQNLQISGHDLIPHGLNLGQYYHSITQHLLG